MNNGQKPKIVYLGSPDFAVPALAALLQAGYSLPLVITQPDRPKGRKRQLAPTAVKQFAEAAGLKVLAVENVNRPEILAEIQAAEPDLLVVAAFGQLLRPAVWQAAPWGAVNIHASLLPEYRGAAPIQQALIDGREKTGVTLMYIEERLDAGDMLARAECNILPEDNAGTLRERLAALGADLLLENLPKLLAGQLPAEPQNEAQATYAGKITAAHELLDWQAQAEELHNLLRGLTPDTSAYTCYQDGQGWQRLKIWRMEVAEAHGNAAAPGVVFGADKKGLLVAAGEGAVRLLQVQPAGKGRMAAADWWRGRQDLHQAGLCFSKPDNIGNSGKEK